MNDSVKRILLVDDNTGDSEALTRRLQCTKAKWPMLRYSTRTKSTAVLSTSCKTCPGTAVVMCVARSVKTR